MNFVAQRTNIYPTEIKELFTELGINWMKETEVTHFGLSASEQHYYNGWFHFKGSFEGATCEIPLPHGIGYT